MYAMFQNKAVLYIFNRLLSLSNTSNHKEIVAVPIFNI